MASKKAPGGFCGIIAGGIGILWLLGTVCSVSRHGTTTPPIGAPATVIQPTQSAAQQADAIYAKIKQDAERQSLTNSKLEKAKQNETIKASEDDGERLSDIQSLRNDASYKPDDGRAPAETWTVGGNNQQDDRAYYESQGVHFGNSTDTNNDIRNNIFGSGTGSVRRGDDGAPKDQHVSGYTRRDGTHVSGYNRRHR